MATAESDSLGNRPPKRPGPAARVEASLERAIALLYAWLARNRVTRLPWAVVQTFSRAQGALLSGSMAYYTFLSLVPLLMLAAFVIVMLLSTVLLGSVGLTIWIGYAARAVFGSEAGPLVRLLSTLASPFSMLVLLLLLYRLLPARRHSWLSQVPGALVGAIGVDLLKRAFALWTERSAGVSALPRSLLSVVLLLIWLGLFAQIVLYGAALNVVLDRRRHRLPLLPDPPGVAADEDREPERDTV